MNEKLIWKLVACIILLIGIILAITSLKGFHSLQDKNELCKNICLEGEYSVGYQIIKDIHGIGNLCVCYHPAIDGNKVSTHTITT